MARAESIALGGYYPTPSHLTPAIADILDVAERADYVFVDPCAGEGTAIMDIAHRAFNSYVSRINLFTCELEKTRHTALLDSIQARGFHYRTKETTLRGDAFQVVFSKPTASFLYLNPPYDQDPVHGRFEERFLARFQSVLAEGGVLAFVVPFYALKASARTLAKEFTNLSCFRFPDVDFEGYKQVVLFAVKTATQMSPDPAIVAQVEAWSASTDGMPILGEPTDIKYTPPQYSVYTPDWNMRTFDRIGLLKKVRPWTQSTRLGSHVPVPHIIKDVPVEDLMFRTYPLATPPRPAHIAAGLATGLFNGRRVAPENKKLPDLLVKGVFDREFVTVEEKTDKSGDVTSVVQVQQPKLVTTILDLRTKKYTTLGTAGKSGSLEVDKMTIEDLLEHYGPSLMTVMQQQCPVMYDPKRDADKVQIAHTKRKLFTAQEHTAKALIMLLGGNKAKSRTYLSAKLLGEIGSGKTSVALAVANTIAKRVLVFCPPHLLTSWKNEAKATVPDAEVRVLKDIGDVESLSDIPKDKLLIAVMSRETAKLGHGWDAVKGSCPKCGGELPKDDVVKKRLHCENQAVVIKDDLGQAAYDFGLELMACTPNDHRLRELFRTRHMGRVLDKLAKVDPLPEWKFKTETVDRLLDLVFPRLMLKPTNEGDLSKLFVHLLLADYNPNRIAKYVKILAKHLEYTMRDLARNLSLYLEQGSEIQQEVVAQFENEHWFSWDNSYRAAKTYGHNTHQGTIKWVEGKVSLDGVEPDSVKLAGTILKLLVQCGKISLTEACGEALYQAVPEPRRVALSGYIAKYYPHLFDLILLDEGHEYQNGDSAQGMAAHRMTGLGIPTIEMTGSVMNGYAKSLYTNMWALSRSFRSDFGREDEQRFIDRYGYRKRIVSDRDRETKEVIAFGSMSDRVERNARTAGDAPGILPLFLFQHLLPVSVTLHKTDLAIDIPPCTVQKHLVEADPELHSSYKSLLNTLKTQIKKDQFEPERSGKLFGQLSEVPSYLDRSTADTGNTDEGLYEIRYPESVGSELVAIGKQFPASTLSAKEEKMLEIVRSELAEGRNVMVFSWHVTLLPRLARIISEAIQENVPILYADKVATGKRQDWIDAKVVKPNARVLVCNPVAIQTGLNNLVHFASQIWMENPACGPIIFRQAVGRVDRIGQKKDTRIHFLVFKDTLQEQMYDLLMRKVEVSVSTDGLDNESMLASAGVGNQHYSGMSIGRQLWAMINED